MTNLINPDVKQGGRRLLQYREMSHLTQRDVERKTLERYGQDYAIMSQQVSRIESGRIEKPPMADLVILGDLYDLSPNEVAELYGYWTPREKGREREDARMVQARQIVKRLPPKQREKFYAWLDFAAKMALSEAAQEGADETGGEGE